MKKMSCWGFPWAKISQCEMPDPSTKTKKEKEFWDRACSDNPTMPGCKLYDSQKGLYGAWVSVNKGFIPRTI